MEVDGLLVYKSSI